MLVIPTSAESGSLPSQRLPKPSFRHGSTMHKIQQRGILRVAINPDAVGFCAPNPRTGRLEGIDVMIARRLAQSIFGGTMTEVRPHVEFVESTMAERMERLKEADVDMVVAALAKTAERRKIADFTSAYYGTALTVVVRRDSKIDSVQDLKRSRVVVVDGSADVDYAERYKIAGEIILAKSNTEMAEILARGDADAALSAAVHLDAYSEFWAEEAVRLPVEFDSYQYAVAVRKGDDELCSFLDVQMTDVVRQGYVAIAASFERRTINL